MDECFFELFGKVYEFSKGLFFRVEGVSNESGCPGLGRPLLHEREGKSNFFSSVLYTSLLTIRYTCTEFNQTIALVGVPSKLLG